MKKIYLEVLWFFSRRLPLAWREKSPGLLWKAYRRKSPRRTVQEEEILWLFYKNHGYVFDFQHPRTLNEKIAVRKLSDDPRLPLLADKLAVRDYVSQRVGEEYLVPLLFAGEEFTVEDFHQLPQKCVLKTTHSSGTNIFIHDKSREKAPRIVRKMKKTQKRAQAYRQMELFYAKINPRIIAEEMLLEEGGAIPRDFKFHCFPNADDGRGKVFIQVDFDRFSGHTRNFYDENWNPLPFRHARLPLNEKGMEMPGKLDEMLDVARKLADGWDYVRVDLYHVGEKIYFGEMTFTPDAASQKFDPPEYDKIWGDEWK